MRKMTRISPIAHKLRIHMLLRRNENVKTPT